MVRDRMTYSDDTVEGSVEHRDIFTVLGQHREKVLMLVKRFAHLIELPLDPSDNCAS